MNHMVHTFVPLYKRGIEGDYKKEEIVIDDFFSITYTKINIRITCKYLRFAGRSTTIRGSPRSMRVKIQLPIMTRGLRPASLRSLDPSRGLAPRLCTKGFGFSLPNVSTKVRTAQVTFKNVPSS